MRPDVIAMRGCRVGLFIEQLAQRVCVFLTTKHPAKHRKIKQNKDKNMTSDLTSPYLRKIIY
jgi:hypothetical protein